MPEDPTQAQASPQAPEAVDVEALMADVRRRVADKQARGLYGVDALMADALEDAGPLDPARMEALRAAAVQRVDLTALPSSKPLVGGALARVKAVMTRGVSQPLYVMAEQTNQFNGALLAFLSALAREASEAAARADRAEARLAELEERVAGLESPDGGGGRSAAS